MPIDVVFLVDGSESINSVDEGGAPGNFGTKMLGFVQNVSDTLDIGMMNRCAHNLVAIVCCCACTAKLVQQSV